MGILNLLGYTGSIWIHWNHFKWVKTSDLIFLHPSFWNINILHAYMMSSRLDLSHLSDTDPRNPEVHGPFIVTAQVLDILRLLLDLRMLETHHTHFINTVYSIGLWAKARFAKSPLFYIDLSINHNMHLPAGNKYTLCSSVCSFAKLVVTVSFAETSCGWWVSTFSLSYVNAKADEAMLMLCLSLSYPYFVVLQPGSETLLEFYVMTLNKILYVDGRGRKTQLGCWIIDKKKNPIKSCDCISIHPCCCESPKLIHIRSHTYNNLVNGVDLCVIKVSYDLN